MTILEIHKTLLERNFSIDIRPSEQTPGAASFTMGRYDFDGLYVFAKAEIYLQDTTNAALYGKFLKEGAACVEEFILRREKQNPATCYHQMVDVNGKQKCNKCRADFGSMLTIKIMDN